VILLSLVLVLASAGLLIAGLGAGDHQLIWGSMVASVLAAICLAVAVFRRRAPIPADGPAARTEPELPVAIDAGPAEPEPARDEPPPDAPPADEPPPERAAAPAPPPDEPAEEETSASDVLRILDLLDEVMVVDQRPRYHLPECPHLIGKDAQPLPISEARGAGFTPCGRCRPDSTLADRARGGST
jgi:hypothetical protein